MEIMKRGALIVLEGCDRSGKTTQCQKVMSWLQQSNIESHFMRFPERSTTIGSLINKYLECSAELEDHAIHLLFSANRWELMPDMKKLLCKGTNIIVDRYSYSGIAFSAAKPNMDLTWCKKSDSGLLKPDLVIFLDIDPIVAQSRGEYGVERYENLEMQKLVRSNYLKLKDETWKVVDASRSVEEVTRDICQLVKETLGSKSLLTEIKQLSF
ncbi:Thymidylate kinase [Daphnia magna]|uniref:Thymidylate kinase n=1 Tax=Daphnia magna TaxID=35525 RepID=A0A0P6AG71_9CRUS|nr:Thymidylate kinase [Daphnia magna]